MEEGLDASSTARLEVPRNLFRVTSAPVFCMSRCNLTPVPGRHQAAREQIAVIEAEKEALAAEHSAAKATRSTAMSTLLKSTTKGGTPVFTGLNRGLARRGECPGVRSLQMTSHGLS